MTLRTAPVLADAWALFRRDRELLLTLAGPFWFLPVLALRLLVPPAPPLPMGMTAGSAEAVAAVETFQAWLGAYGGWFAIGAMIGAIGTVALFVLYLDRDRPDLRTALRRGARLWPRFLLLNLLTALPSAAGLLLFYVPGLYILARVMAAGPALVAEAPIGAWAAVRRSFALSRGAVLTLMALEALTLVLGLLAPQPLVALDDWLRARAGGPNPVALVLVDALAAAAAAASLLVQALIAVAAYRRLAR